jgi:CRP-like cAMP-binding protein
MAPIRPDGRSPNWVLSHLSPADLRLIRPHLEAVDLPKRRYLEEMNKPIEHVYFIERGFASVVSGRGNRPVEVGMIGCEGMSGMAVIMGAERSPNETYMQLAGSGQRISSARLRQSMKRSATLGTCFLRYAHVFSIQIAQTAFANGRGKLEERLARWLLMAHDRSEGDEMALTHQFLALMLTVRRPGVTVALNLLEEKGLTKRARGVIAIVDRKGLVGMSNGTYGVPEQEFKRLFG